MLFHPEFGFRRDPFALLRQMQRGLDPSLFASPGNRNTYPPVTLWQGEDSLALTAELPGVDPDSLAIEVHGTRLTLSGERKAPEVAEEQKTVWHRRERGFGRFTRVLELPYRVDADQVEARLRDGILEIELHRPEADKRRRIAITAH